MLYRALFAALLLLPSPVYAGSLDDNPFSNNALGTLNGRFVFGQVSKSGGDQFLLDTQSGRLWRMVRDNKKGTHMRPVKFIQLHGEESSVPEPQINDERQQAQIRADTMERLEAGKK